MKLKKVPFVGPVTAVRFSDSGELVYVGMGSAVHVYCTASGELRLSTTAIDGRVVHGFDISSAGKLFPAHVGCVAAVFGHKKVKIFSHWPDTAADGAAARSAAALPSPSAVAAAGQAPSPALTLLCELPELDDLVWDTRLLRPSARAASEALGERRCELAVALAHNFVELWAWGETTSASSRAAAVRMQRVCSAEMQVVFTMGFFGDAWSTLRVATGTVMNQILLWTPGGAREDASGATHAVAPVQQRLLGHRGEVFRVVWSEDGSALASCSADRTVRLWRAGAGGEFALRWTGWGHKERLWDVRFCALGLITASEDKTCKIWDPERDACIATLDGHGGHHIWKVAVDWSGGGRGLRAITGGNDAAAQLWQLGQHVVGSQQLFSGNATPHGEHETMHGIAVLPLPPVECAALPVLLPVRDENSSARFLRFLSDFAAPSAERGSAAPAPCFEMFPAEEPRRRPLPARATASLQQAPIRTVRFRYEERCEAAGGGRELAAYVGTSNATLWRGVLQAHSHGAAAVQPATGMEWTLLHNAEAWGSALCTFSVSPSTVDEAGLVAMASPAGEVALLFPADRLAPSTLLPFVHWRAHNTRVSNIFWPSAPALHFQKSVGAPQRSMFTAAADGSLRWWNLEGSEQRQGPQLLAEFKVYGKGVVTSVLVLWEQGLCLCGDNRGNIFVFPTPEWHATAAAGGSIDGKKAEEVLSHLSVVRRIHGQDAVTVLVSRGGYVYSAGHDGNVRQFRPMVAADSGAPPQLREVAYYSTAPVNGVTSLFWSDNGTMLVAGFYAADFIVADIQHHYVFARWPSGGWKRPHAFWFDHSNPMQGIVLGFAPPAPKGKAKHSFVPALHVQSTLAMSGITHDAISQASPRKPPPAVSSWSLHSSFHGSVIKAARWVGGNGPWAQLLLTGCQDNTLRLSRFDSAGVIQASISREAHSAGIRALAVSRPAVAGPEAQTDHIVFASVGGKEEMTCWQMLSAGPQHAFAVLPPKSLLTPRLSTSFSSCPPTRCRGSAAKRGVDKHTRSFGLVRSPEADHRRRFPDHCSEALHCHVQLGRHRAILLRGRKGRCLLVRVRATFCRQVHFEL